MYLKKRVLRIFPALIVVVLLTVFFVEPSRYYASLNRLFQKQTDMDLPIDNLSVHPLLPARRIC
jgi:regulatory protein YycI of two-component signal transduction system YycFG